MPCSLDAMPGFTCPNFTCPTLAAEGRRKLVAVAEVWGAVPVAGGLAWFPAEIWHIPAQTWLSRPTLMVCHRYCQN